MRPGAAGSAGGSGAAEDAPGAGAPAACTAAHTASEPLLPPVPDVPYLPPRPSAAWVPSAPAPTFYDWREVFPFLQPLVDAAPTITAEVARAVGLHGRPAAGAGGAEAGAPGAPPGAAVPGAPGCAPPRGRATWHDWPETALYRPEMGHDWKVLPFAYTFPADDPAATVWLPAAEAACPFTAALLRRVPGLRTALLSRLGPATALVPHQGWANLSNHVLRVHLGLVVPGGPHTCGVCVEDDLAYHTAGGLLVFDDAKVHSAFNHSGSEARVVLIIDIARPPCVAPGGATQGTTAELEEFLAKFH
jgi:hypothetical protein